MNAKDNNRIIEANMSIRLNTSPVKTNIPFIKSNPAQNRVILSQGSTPNIMLKNTVAEMQSIAPRILTNTIKNPHYFDLIMFWFRIASLRTLMSSRVIILNKMERGIRTRNINMPQ